MIKDIHIKNAYDGKSKKDKSRVKKAFIERFNLTQRAFHYKINGINSTFSDEETEFMSIWLGLKKKAKQTEIF